MKAALVYWYKRYFSDPEAGIILLFSLFVLLVLTQFHRMLAPVLVSVVIAYLLEWGVAALVRIRCPHFLAVLVVFILFLAILVLIFIGLLPPLSKQLTNLITEMPHVVLKLQAILHDLPRHFPFITSAQIQNVLNSMQAKMGHFGQAILSISFTVIPNIIVFVVYLVMVPMLVYFFLMDKNTILTWLSTRFIPQRRRVFKQSMERSPYSNWKLCSREGS